MKLISMTAFVLEQHMSPKGHAEISVLCFNYAKLLTTPLELWMFIPCDEKGVKIKEPSLYKKWIEEKKPEKFAPCIAYQKAKDRVLFEGMEIYNPNAPDYIILLHEETAKLTWKVKESKFSTVNLPTYTVEDLVKFKLKLTPTVIKQIGVNAVSD